MICMNMAKHFPDDTLTEVPPEIHMTVSLMRSSGYSVWSSTLLSRPESLHTFLFHHVVFFLMPKFKYISQVIFSAGASESITNCFPEGMLSYSRWQIGFYSIINLKNFSFGFIFTQDVWLLFATTSCTPTAIQSLVKQAGDCELPVKIFTAFPHC